MSKSKPKNGKAISLKKEMRQQVADQLQTALNGSLIEKLGKKEFESRVKKAAKLLTAGIKTKPVKTSKKKESKKDNAETTPKAE